MRAEPTSLRASAIYLPDLCTGRAALAVVLIIELTALVLSCARSGSTGVSFWTDLARTSTFLLWIGLIGACLLCSARTRLARLGIAQGSALVLLMVATIVTLVSQAALVAGRSALIHAVGAQALFPTNTWEFVARNVLISLIVTGLALRYFYVMHEWRRNV
jgi:two-component system, LytTR family, sensor histidine kinase AlgZ